MREETTAIGGHPFHIRHWGDPGLPTLLMLHGFPEYGRAWSDLAPRLSHRFHCVAPDQRGFGQSWAPEGTEHYALSRLVSDMAELIGALQPPVIVLGHDWGSAVAYGLAIFRPDLVSRLIVANGVHPIPFQRALAAGGEQSAASQYINHLRASGAAEKLAADGFALLERFFTHGLGPSWEPSAGMAAYRREWARPGRLEAMLNWYRASPLRVARPGEPLTDLPDLDPDRLAVRCPHLLIWGPEDTALLPEATEGLEAVAPDLTRVTIPGAGHWLHHQEPQAVADAILGWVDGP